MFDAGDGSLDSLIVCDMVVLHGDIEVYSHDDSFPLNIYFVQSQLTRKRHIDGMLNNPFTAARGLARWWFLTLQSLPHPVSWTTASDRQWKEILLYDWSTILSILIWKFLPGTDSNCHPRILNSEIQRDTKDGELKHLLRSAERPDFFPLGSCFHIPFQIYFILKKVKRITKLKNTKKTYITLSHIQSPIILLNRLLSNANDENLKARFVVVFVCLRFIQGSIRCMYYPW